jgi:hypothetical protein
VEGLQLAQDAESRDHRRNSSLSVTQSDDGQSAATSETGDESLLQPGRASSIPPTPDLIHNRSSTAMSFASTATTPERSSQQYTVRDDIPTKIIEDDEEDYEDNEAPPHEPTIVHKRSEPLLHRSSGARISALGGAR